MKKISYKKILALILVVSIVGTSFNLAPVAQAIEREPQTDSEENDRIQIQEEGKIENDYDVEEDDIEEDFVYEESAEATREEVKKERTKNSTTWKLSDGNQQIEYYSGDVRYEEDGELLDYDPSLVQIKGKKSKKGADISAYSYENAQGNMKHYIPKNLNQKTPIRMENGKYSLEISPLFDAQPVAGQLAADNSEESGSDDAEEADSPKSKKKKKNEFSKVAKVKEVKVKKEKVKDLYGKKNEKQKSAVYTSDDESFELEYIPFESGVKENLVLHKKPEENVWQFAFTLDGDLKARENTINEGISFYTQDDKDEEILAGGIQVPYMNDATGEKYSEAITYDLETVSQEEGSYLLTMTVDKEYLEDPETVYPVTIDPSYTWTGSSAVYDVYVLSGSSYADMNFYDSTTTGMFAGRTNANGYERTYISFNGLASKVSGYSIASAKFTIYETGGGTAGETVEAHAVNAAWDKSTLTWNNRPAYSSTVLSSFVNTATANHSGVLNITSYVRKVANGSNDYGIMLRTAAEATSKYAKFYGSRHSSTTYRPKLVVTYCEKPADATSVTLEKNYIKLGATATISWEGIESTALKSIQYRLAEYDYANKVVGDTLLNYADTESLGTTASGTKTITQASTWAEGEYRIYVRGLDKYGSVGTGKGVTLIIDGTNPTLASASITPSTTETAPGGNAQPVIKWSGAADKYFQKVQYSVDGGIYKIMGSDPSGSFTVPADKITTAGKHTIKVRSVDKANNVSTAKTLYYYYDENTLSMPDWAPTNLTLQKSVNYKNVLKWNCKGTEELPGSITYEVYRSTTSGFTPDESTLAASGIRTYYWYEPNVAYSGTYYYKVRAVRTDNSGKVVEKGSFSAEVSGKVTAAAEYDKFLGIKDYWGYQSLETPMGSGQAEESKGNLVYQQEDVSLPEAELGFGITRTYNSQSTAKTGFGIGWDHNFNLELLRVCTSTGAATDTYIFKNESGSLEYLTKQTDGSYVSGGTKELHLYERGNTEDNQLELDETHTVEWQYRLEDKAQDCWYFNSSGQIIAITEPSETWILLHYDKKQGMLTKAEASSGKSLDFTYQDSAAGEQSLIKSIVLPDKSTLNYSYSGQQLLSMSRKSADGSQSVTYPYIWSNGKISSIKDAEGNAYGIAYDSSGKVSAMTLPDGEKTELTYSTSTKKTTITKKTSAGSVILTESVLWNDSGNILSYTDPQGKVTTYTYQDNCLTSTTSDTEWETLSNGRVVFHTGKKTSSTEYDSQGNITQDTDEDGNVTTYTYGDTTNPYLVTKEVTINNGITIEDMRYAYDELGRIIREENPLSNLISQYIYSKSLGRSLDGQTVSTTEKQDGQIVVQSQKYYDAGGNLISEENKTGTVTVSAENQYDAMGNLLESVSSDGTKTVYSYDFMGRLLKQQDYDKNGSLAQTLETSYYPNGQVKSEVAADGSVSSYTYDSRNRVIKRIVTADGSSRTWSTTYGYGNVSVKNGKGTGTDTIQNAAKVMETDPTGAQSVTWTDNCGQTVRQTANGLNSDIRYDKANNEFATIISAVSDGSISSVTLLLYDEKGCQTNAIRKPGYLLGSFTVASDSIQTSQVYDIKGNVISSTDELGNQTQYTYDDSGRILSVKEGGNTTSYSYTTDSSGNSHTETKRAGGGISTTVEDSGGRTLYISDQGSDKEIRTSYEYDADGMLIKQKQADGSYLSYTYDSQGRQSRIDTCSAGGDILHSVRYEYDKAGHVTAMKDYDKTNGVLSPSRYTGYSYNTFGELTGSWEVDGTAAPSNVQKTAHLISYAYQADGLPVSVTYADNGNGVKKLNYIYNAQKQLTQITALLTDGRTRTLCDYTYTADGKVAKRKDYEDFAGTGNQYIERSYTYDAFDRVLTMTYTESSSGKTTESHTYSYDKASHILKEETNLNWSGQKNSVKETKNYTYDTLGQLKKSILTDQDQLETTTEYTYDAAGNRLGMVKTRKKDQTQVSKTEASYTYNQLDQLLTSSKTETTGSSTAQTISSIVYSYDANGNLKITSDNVSGTETAYTYDSQGQLTRLQIKNGGVVSFTQENRYNGNGQRIRKTEGSDIVSYYYQDNTVLMTEDGSGNLKTFDYLGIATNPLFTMRKRSDNEDYYTYEKDLQGSTRAVTDNDGNCAEWYTYADFGETEIHQEKTGFANVICYTGAVYDENTGLYYLNARYYNPEIGRFLTMDTYRGKSDEPDTLHLYKYCLNDPVNYVDPSGHNLIAVGLGISASCIIDFSHVFFAGIDNKGKLVLFSTTTLGAKVGTGAISKFSSGIQYMYISHLYATDLKGWGFNAGVNVAVGPIDIDCGPTITLSKKESGKIGFAVSAQISKKLKKPQFNVKASGSYTHVWATWSVSSLLKNKSGTKKSAKSGGKTITVKNVNKKYLLVTLPKKINFRINSKLKIYEFHKK